MFSTNEDSKLIRIIDTLKTDINHRLVQQELDELEEFMGALISIVFDRGGFCETVLEAFFKDS